MTVNECAKALGEAIAATEAVKTFTSAKAEWEANDQMQAYVREYNAQRMLLGQEFAKDREMQDNALIDRLQARVDELYKAVAESELYLRLEESQKQVGQLMEQVNSDIQFYAFGERPCTHDCSSCGASCASREG